MSQYIHVFAGQNNQFIPLYSEGRPNYLYKALEPFVPYEKVRKLSLQTLEKAIEDLNEILSTMEKAIASCTDTIEKVLQMNNSVEDKLMAIEGYQEDINNQQEEKAFLVAAIERLRLLHIIAEDMALASDYENAAEDLGLYAGIECGFSITAADVIE